MMLEDVWRDTLTLDEIGDYAVDVEVEFEHYSCPRPWDPGCAPERTEIAWARVLRLHCEDGAVLQVSDLAPAAVAWCQDEVDDRLDQMAYDCAFG